MDGGCVLTAEGRPRAREALQIISAMRKRTRRALGAHVVLPKLANDCLVALGGHVLLPLPLLLPLLLPLPPLSSCVLL